MKWFYSKRGTEQQHGLIDEAMLRDMVRTGELRPDDLLWPESSGHKWIPASSIPGLFPALALPSSVRQPPGQHVDPHADLASSSGARDHGPQADLACGTGPDKRAVAAVAAGLLVIGTVIIGLLMRGCSPDAREPVAVQPDAVIASEPDPEPEPFIPRHEPRDWSSTIRKIEAGIALHETNTTSELLTRVLSDNETNPVVLRLALQLQQLCDSLDTLAKLNSALRNGSLKQGDASLLAELNAQYDKQNPLLKTVREMLDNKDALTGDMCVSASFACSARADTNTMMLCSRRYIALTTERTSIESCLGISRALASAGLTDEAQRLLHNFLANQPDSAAAWIELSAIQCLAGNQKDALDSLKTATELGGDEIRARAKSDSHFDTIRDNWRFKRYTRM
ncbi:MAG: hypothetical protein E4H02_10065 [Lentisphaerales bacterium]|jgi:hypothetical protein|nr:MAG: hypothetical protein E4H02_10065 [Lentisphaerales bacterium]